MDAWWLSPALVAAGVIIQVLREARSSGRRDERISQNSISIATLETVTVDLGRRVATIEGRCEVMEHNKR